AKTGELYEPTGNLLRLHEQPNPFDSLNDIVYKSVFSKYSDGNSYLYTKTPKSVVNPTYDNISNLWILQPDVTAPVFKKEISNPFLIKDKGELIEFYKTFFMYKHQIDPRYITQSTVLGLDEKGRGVSPLTRVSRNIDNI